jgi:hypothetical protein
MEIPRGDLFKYPPQADKPTETGYITNTTPEELNSSWNLNHIGLP